MINTIQIDKELADKVEKEFHSIKPNWQYMPFTTNFYSITKDESERKCIDEINEKYGPVIDTQRFTYEFYNQKSNTNFKTVRGDPNSAYNKHFPGLARLVGYLQLTYLPNTVVTRLMANMQTIRPTWSMNAPHPDFRNPSYMTILYYANDSDGDTYFFKGSECIHRASPVKGTAAIYPSNMFHAGSTPTKTETRVVINMCFGPKDS